MKRALGPLVALTLLDCTRPPPPPPVIRPFSDPGSVARAQAATASSGGEAPRPARAQLRLRGASEMPDVSAAPQCAASILGEIERMRNGNVTLQGEPLCTQDYNGEWAAVFATGTATEASDLWVIIAANGRVERHRVRRAPYGVRYTAGTIQRGLVALVGKSVQAEEMPANADVLVTFALPFPGNPAPSVLELQPETLPLLGSADRSELESRAQTLASEQPPTAESVQPLLTRAGEGPRGLIGTLPATQSVPVLRAWQLGVYERLAELHAQLDPGNARVSTGSEIMHRLAERAVCAEGWRCVQRPEGRPLPEVAVALQAQFKRAGTTSVLAAVIDAGSRPEAAAQPSADHMGAPRSNDPQDRAVALSVAFDPIEGPVVGNSRGDVRLVAFTTREGERRVTQVYVAAPNRAPRRFTDDSLGGLATGARALELRDIDGNDEPELLVAARVGEAGAVGAATLFWPPTVTDRTTFPRLDAMRVLVEATSIEDAGRALRSFAPSPFESDEQLCQAVSRINGASPRQLSSMLAGNGFVRIEYATDGQPLRGTLRRMTTAEVRSAADAAALFGPFASIPCSEMQCDSALGYCRLERERREVGYLWVAGRRNQPFWGVSLRAAR